MESKESYAPIAGIPVDLQKGLTKDQMAAISFAKSMSGENSYPPEIMAQYNRQREQATISKPKPATADSMKGTQASLEKAQRAAGGATQGNTVIAPTAVVNNSAQNNTVALTARPSVRSSDRTFGAMSARNFASPGGFSMSN